MLPAKPQPKGGLGEKFQKTESGDLSGGPVKQRQCRDLLCVILFLGHAGFFWFTIASSFSKGNPARLYLPRDFRGDYCDAASGNTSMSTLSFTMSMTSTVDTLALKLLCSAQGRQFLLADEVSTVCGSSSSGSLSLSSLSQATASLSDPLQFFAGQSSGLLPTPGMLMNEASKSLNAVCSSTCSSVKAHRTFIYSPPPNAKWAPVWQRVVDATSADSAMQAAFKQFSYKALSYEDCPYSPRYCVPVPGFDFVEGPNNVCIPQVTGALASALGDQITAGLNQLSSLGVSQDISSGLDSAVTSISTTLDALVVVAFSGLVLGLISMMLIRFFTAPVVWFFILAIFLLLLGSGLAALVRASQCLGTDFFAAGRAFAEREAVGLQGSLENATHVSSPLQLNSNGSSSSCEGDAYAVRDSFLRQALQVCGYVLLSFAGLWALLILCLCRRIRLAIAVNEVAAQFVANKPQILLVPLVQTLLGMGWLVLWGFCAAFLLSYVPEGSVPSGAFATQLEAAGNSSTPGACTSRWPAGFAYEDLADCQGANGTVAKCWYCAPPRFAMDERFAFAFFSFLWHNALSIAMGQCIIAGAVGSWFFAERKSKSSHPVVCPAVRNALIYSFGSLAFGSLILASVQFAKWVMRYLAEQAKVQKNTVAVMVFRAIACCLWCFEKCLKFMNENAYIQVALMGTSFCTSAKNAFFLILRNAVRFGALAMLGPMISLVAMTFITCATAIAGFCILQVFSPNTNPLVPVACYVVVGYTIAKLFINVFALACDTSLQCFITAEEMHHRGDFMPSSLQRFIADHDLKDKSQSSRCCRCLR
eukprot:TRINITY_DN74574_c0_g1_i1.p1 TRINITY_DN74574_c0_g1~~TRINITY_DN74574_c0_g1_i1.p1  ORF type:complete len:817 (+),score=126.61 TRINITY_DN74574_c0_g1_i1:41-2491(+)